VGRKLISRKKLRSSPQGRGGEVLQPRNSFVDQMADFLHRNKNWFLIAGFSLILLQDIFGTHGVLAMRRTQLQAKEVQKEIERLNEENRKLQNRVQHLKSDPATLEGIARDEMHLKRPGEFVFPIAPKSGAPNPSQPAENPQKP
jgi:cell division protein FtsB